MGFSEMFNVDGLSNENLFYDYYRLMMNMGDCDPAFPILNYICDRFELTIEQRFWIAFLYGATYCAPTVYYIYNEFPDYENISFSRMENWWLKNKEKTIFQTDRAIIKNADQFVDMVKSYVSIIGKEQYGRFSALRDYNGLYELASEFSYFGRFSIFNYTQALWELTPVKFEPTFFNLKEAGSCKDGLCYVFDYEKYIRKKHSAINYKTLQRKLDGLLSGLKAQFLYLPVNIWNVETALCAYKKLFWGTRYLGYYIDRQQEEIQELEKRVNIGVNWSPLWDFRSEFYGHELLGEFCGWDGVRKSRMKYFKAKRKFGNSKDYSTYKRKIGFENSGICYEI